MKRTGTIISAALLHLTLLPHKEVGMRAEAVDAACSLSACFCVPGRKLLLGAGGGGGGTGSDTSVHMRYEMRYSYLHVQEAHLGVPTFKEIGLGTEEEEGQCELLV